MFEEPFGDRLRRHRQRAGMSRPVLGGLVGRSAEWVKALESGRLRTPRLELLIRLAHVLGVEDLADLTGDERIAAASYVKPAHEATPEVARALTSYQLAQSGEPVSGPALKHRVRRAWQLWHGSRTQRGAVATFLPGLLRDAQLSARLLDGDDRREARRLLAQTYHLAQLFLSFQPFPELIHLTGDRAMAAAQDADDPYAIAAAAWYLNHVYRDAGERHEARVDLATQAASLLRPERGPADLASWGLLQLAVALSHAKAGQDGAAWRAWDKASETATALGDDYTHPWLVFGRGMVDAYAITMHADLMRPGEAVRQADHTEISAIPSATRRSFHLIETARAYSLRREPAATVYLLRRAYDESPDTIRFNLFSRSAVRELVKVGPSTVRDDVRDLARRLGIAA